MMECDDNWSKFNYANKFDLHGVFGSCKMKGYDKIKFIREFVMDTFETYQKYKPLFIFLTDYNIYLPRNDDARWMSKSVYAKNML